MKAPRLVLVHWLDSRQAEPHWQHASDIRGGVCECQSVGWLLKDGKKAKVLAASVADGFDQASAVIRIPACAVTRIVDLVEGRDG
jgi:hypothetical protein